MTFQWLNPAASSEGKSAAKPQTAVSSFRLEEDSIKGAETALTKISPRIPNYAHLEAVVIGNNLAKKGIHELIDLVGREFQIRRTKYLLVAEKKGEDILQAKTPFEMQATDLRKILTKTNQSVSFNNFMKHYEDPDVLAFLPIVHTVPAKEIKGSPENQAKETLEIEGMAFFEKDRMIAQLNGSETKAWLFTQGKITKGTIVQLKGKEKETAIFQSLSQSRKLDIDVSSLPIKATLKIHTTGKISETSGQLTLEQPENLQKVRKQLEATIQQQIKQFIDMSQKKKKDMLLLGREIRSYHPNKWNEIKDNWSDIYSSVQFRVEINIEIKNTGRLR